MTNRPSLPFARTSLLTALTSVAAVLALLAGPLAVPAEAARYTPPAGVKTNDPLGGRDARRAVIGHVIKSINAVPRKGQIRIASWNVRSDDIVDALIRAHAKRKVGVKVVMDRLNANPDNPNRGVNRLQRALKEGNGSRKPYLRSGLRKCVSACRGRGGIAHSKFFLFSQAGKARWVVMNGSFNATDLAAYGQWNDMYTVVGRKPVYQELRTVFAQMWQDENVKQGYRHRAFGRSLTTMVYPWRGKGTQGDPVLRELSKISCTGARNTSSGRTKIRISMTSWHGERGKKIAWAVRRKQNSGCNVKIVYAVAGNEVLRILRREGAKPVPLRQVTQDFNGDGVYDRYLHTKVLTVRGHYGNDRRATMTLNGSANWSPAALPSDEVLIRLQAPGVLKRYNGFVERLYRNPPPRSRPAAGRTARTGAVQLPEHLPLGTLVDGVDPYALIQEG
ncbi:phosphatidylserine/phosphatidylglycerophosphate/cardiolipin synthase family protein [Nocardioides sp. Arc9.136]|uniref:phospholipase D-like domain-containing protein n=1 Tax=Nocardioides sp. Arc9.136 TaxID=2996826 RepID=UPI00266552D5|nr:phospholipase D-like domain-containing protein [Nocardioides sp. Arc9.136]WKN49818.1 phospholipase D-like domain-containing protein [Nocardioides sp. Arc9.136]